ncbi:hypothetical protein SAMN05421874_101523 [Nonomuraea maritima]|uniref:Uncharacterized protein n=1 Tax=Nonomuraea maritima TaxID=683260 RepID=A0A1G8T0C0_9ACTN|nr:hypothetical protein SAMN05421874_101523 [Nonomuraea maritima]
MATRPGPARSMPGVAHSGLCAAHACGALGITPAWLDGTGVGGSSFPFHVRPAAAAAADLAQAADMDQAIKP